jgi:hypothetical protein
MAVRQALFRIVRDGPRELLAPALVAMKLTKAKSVDEFLASQGEDIPAERIEEIKAICDLLPDEAKKTVDSSENPARPTAAE